MKRYRERYINFSVKTRIISNPSDPNGSEIVREVRSMDEFLHPDHDIHGYLPQICPLHGSDVSSVQRGRSQRRNISFKKFQNACSDRYLMESKHNQRPHSYGYTNSSRRGRGTMPRMRGRIRHRLEDTKKRASEMEVSKWFKITIPFGKEYDKNWLLTSLQNQCPINFTPVHYSTWKSESFFYLKDSAAASALLNLSHTITDTDGFKVAVFMNPCSYPSVPKHAQYLPQNLEHLKHCMSKRFDSSLKSLDLNSIWADPDLNGKNITVTLNHKHCVQAVMKIIEENIPELLSLNLSNNIMFSLDHVSALVSKVPDLQSLNLSRNELKTEWDLDMLKGIRLRELWLNQNPLCYHFEDQTSYIRDMGTHCHFKLHIEWPQMGMDFLIHYSTVLPSIFLTDSDNMDEKAVRERFPSLLKLDGQELPTPIGFSVSTHISLPACKGSHFVSDEIKNVIEGFLQQFFRVYDSGHRQQLLEAYHDVACFSLSLPPMRKNSRCRLIDFLQMNRNLKMVLDSTSRFRLLKHSRLATVAFLNELPKTQHDMNSIIVDVNTYTSTLLVFTVSGMFREIDSTLGNNVLAFSRVFITVPALNSGLSIINDELFVRNATVKEIGRAFVSPPPSTSHSLGFTCSPKMQMLSAFSQESAMNLEWAQKCLEDNYWDYNQAVLIFKELKARGQIPEAAFIKPS